MVAHPRLSPLEASFLALERPGLPMHVAGVVVFDPSSHPSGPVTLTELRRHVAVRLHRLPRYTQRVSFGRLGLSWPERSETTGVDLDAHLFHHRLPAPGRPSQVNELCARIHAELLPRDRPLWQMHLIDGLAAGGRQALVVKSHHSITDGIAAVQIAETLFDAAQPRRNLANGGLPSLQFGRQERRSILGVAQAAMGIIFTAGGGPIAAPGPYNGAVGAHRAFATATIPMNVIRQLKRELGGSVDDVLLALVASGMSRQLARDRYPVLPNGMRAMLPVSTWRSLGTAELRNHVTAVFVDLPLDGSDLPALVRRIAASKSNLRAEHAAAGMSMLIEAAGLLPRPLHEAIIRFAGALRSSNLVLSDVPGSDEPLFLRGRRILACYPMIPLPPSVGLSVAAVSMGGQMGIGIVADPDLLPRPQRLAAGIEAALSAYDRSQNSSATSSWWRFTPVTRRRRLARAGVAPKTPTTFAA